MGWVINSPYHPQFVSGGGGGLLVPDKTVHKGNKVIQEVQIGGFDLMILVDTNITNQAYFRNRLGYDVVCSPIIPTASGGIQGGVCLVI